MIISHSRKFVFFACAKTGTTSVERILQPYHDGADVAEKAEAILSARRKQDGRAHNLRHVRPAILKEVFPPEAWDQYFKFVFVRNPWDWMLSSFCYNFRTGLRRNLFEATHVERAWKLQQFFNQGTGEGYYQSDFVFGEDGAPLVDFVGRYERLQEDFDEACRRAGLAPELLPVVNRTRHKPYREVYTEEARDLVARLLERDIAAFGYEF